MGISEASGRGDDGGGGVKERAAVPMYSMQALWDGKMTVKDFEVEGRDHLPHNVFEQDEALPVIDVQALLGADRAARAAQMVTMLEAAKTWGFFKIRNHGVPLQVVWSVFSMHYLASMCCRVMSMISLQVKLREFPMHTNRQTGVASLESRFIELQMGDSLVQV